MGASLALPAARAQEPSAQDVVNRAETALWGKTLQAQLTMTVTTARWERTLTLDAWIERPRRSFIRILAPSKEAGIASLRIGPEMWNYLPTVERTIRIPPSMMMQPWMGSDFTNDDLVKESSVVEDYAHRITGSDTAAGAPVYVVESVPKPDAAVVCGSMLSRCHMAGRLVPFEDGLAQLVVFRRYVARSVTSPKNVQCPLPTSRILFWNSRHSRKKRDEE